MKKSWLVVFATLIATFISHSLGALPPPPPPPYNSWQLFPTPSPDNMLTNMVDVTSSSLVAAKVLEQEDSIVEKADYGYWNPKPYYNGDHAAPIPHAKVPN